MVKKREKQDFEVNDDIIDAVLQLVIEMAPNFSRALAAQVAERARENMGGEQYYVARPRYRLDLQKRDADIRRDHRAGERAGLLARRYKLSPRRILQIVRDDAQP